MKLLIVLILFHAMPANPAVSVNYDTFDAPNDCSQGITEANEENCLKN